MAETLGITKQSFLLLGKTEVMSITRGETVFTWCSFFDLTWVSDYLFHFLLLADLLTAYCTFCPTKYLKCRTAPSANLRVGFGEGSFSLWSPTSIHRCRLGVDSQSPIFCVGVRLRAINFLSVRVSLHQMNWKAQWVQGWHSQNSTSPPWSLTFYTLFNTVYTPLSPCPHTPTLCNHAYPFHIKTIQNWD